MSKLKAAILLTSLLQLHSWSLVYAIAHNAGRQKHREVSRISISDSAEFDHQGHLRKHLRTADFKDDGTTSISNGIYPTLREWGCGHNNMEVPKLLHNPGHGKYIVDVGLGSGADETIHAVKNGYVVFSFEPNKGNMLDVMRKIKTLDAKLQSAFHVVNITASENGDSWVWPQLAKPDSGRGFAYIFIAGLSDVEGSSHMQHKSNLVGNIGNITKIQQGHTPVLRLDAVLPDWVDKVELLKIDTQGWELKVLHGAQHSLSQRRFRHVLYEFSPWLMSQHDTGDPLNLLKLLPSTGAMCFDMIGIHNRLPRPSSPLEKYLERLTSGKHGTMRYNKLVHTCCGPWEDIMCFWPDDSRASDDLHLTISQGIFPLLRDWGCGHKAFGTPNLFYGPTSGKYRVDASLGTSTSDALRAVTHGYVSFNFEQNRSHFQAIKRIVKADADMSPKFHFIEPSRDQHGRWKLPELSQVNGTQGYTYVVLAGLSDKEEHCDSTTADTVCFPLDTVLPEWVDNVELFRVGTRGSELSVFRGAQKLLARGAFKYLLYQFWPRHMKQTQDPMNLLKLLPSFGALCYDMVGAGHDMSRPNSPLVSYYNTLARSGSIDDWPWQEIMCQMPTA